MHQIHQIHPPTGLPLRRFQRVAPCGTEGVYTRAVPIDTTRPAILELLAAARLPVASEPGKEGVSA